MADEVDFPQEGFEKEEPLPFVELQYPAKGCKEKYIELPEPSSPRASLMNLDSTCLRPLRLGSLPRCASSGRRYSKSSSVCVGLST